jgi:hypothetical protein
MAAPPAPDPLSLEEVLEAVDHLSPAQIRELERRLAARRAGNSNMGSDEATLVRAATGQLPAAAERRLKKLSENRCSSHMRTGFTSPRPCGAADETSTSYKPAGSVPGS